MSQHAQKGSLKVFDASAYCVGIVVSEFNSDITSKLLESTLEKCREYGVLEKNITIHKVSGCIEIPLIISTMAMKGIQEKKFDCLVALGVVMRGETSHFDYVCNFITDGVLRVTLDHSTPIGFGIITCDTPAQAHARYSFGSHAVEAVLQSAKILREYYASR
jgi:6,7-dimethyl-8-ribityllumazine synthase